MLLLKDAFRTLNAPMDRCGPMGSVVASAIMDSSILKPCASMEVVFQAMLIMASEDASGLLDLDNRAAKTANFSSMETASLTAEAGTSLIVLLKDALPVRPTVQLVSAPPFASHVNRVSRSATVHALQLLPVHQTNSSMAVRA